MKASAPTRSGFCNPSNPREIHGSCRKDDCPCDCGKGIHHTEETTMQEPAYAAPVPRDLTVGELRVLLDEYPEHHSVAPVVDGMVGVFQGVLAKATEDGTPVLLIGEVLTGNVQAGTLS